MNWAFAKRADESVYHAIPVRDPDGSLPQTVRGWEGVLHRYAACGAGPNTELPGDPIWDTFGGGFPVSDKDGSEDFGQPRCAECVALVDQTPSMERRRWRQRNRERRYWHNWHAGIVAYPIEGAGYAVGRNRIAAAMGE